MREKISMANNYALYYPTIEFQNPSWLWAASLFWDRIYRIMPEGYIGSESRNIKELMSDGTIGLPLNPKRYSNAISKEFIEKYNSDTWKAPALGNYEFMKEEYIRLHTDKVDVKLRNLFMNEAFEFNKEWINVPKHIASLYMLYLANHIADVNNLCMVTDRSEALVGASYFKYNGQVDDFYDFSDNVLASIIMKEIIPTNLLNIPAERILEFRRKRKDERNRFVESIKNLSDNISCCEDPKVIDCIINDYMIEVNDSLREFKKSADILKVSGWTGIRSLVFPALAPIINSIYKLSDTQNNLLQGAGIIVGAIAGINDYKRNKLSNLKNFKHSYLLELGRFGEMYNFNHDYVDYLNYQMNNFIYD
jgi:hypothetical protein